METLFLSDLSHVTAGGLTSEFIPYGVGCIKSYFCEHGKSRDHFDLRLFQDPQAFIEQFQREKPAIIAFSNYSWNRDVSYALAEEVKRLRPATLVIFGGPNYPLEDELRELWFKKFAAVDIYVTGEGERPFAALLDLWHEVHDIEALKRAGIDGCHALVDGRVFRANDITPRLESLDIVPSPYVRGYLDEFLADPKLVPLTETNRGCPFQCTFCEKGVSSWNKLTFGSMPRFEEEIRYIAQSTKSSFLVLADNNFGMFKQDVEAARAMTRAYREFGYPLQVYSATGKSRYDRVVEAVSELEGRMPVTVAVQTLDKAVLKNIKRKNLPLENLIEVSSRRYSADQRSRSEVILGLPGDTRAGHINTLCELLDAGVSFLLAYTLILLDGSELGTAESRRKWDMRTKFRINHRCFGSYQFGERRLRATEIEEVVVSSDTLIFDDYLECRSFYLSIGVFYMDEILFELLEFLKVHGVKPSQFVRYVHTEGRKHFDQGLRDLYESFAQATRNELWDCKQDLLDYMNSADRSDEEIRGVGGYNVIYWHRAHAFRTLVDAIVSTGFACARDLLAAEVLSEHHDYLAQLERYMRLRKRNVFDCKQVFRDRFEFDFVDLDRVAFMDEPRRLERPLEIEFSHNHEQTALFGSFHDNGTAGAARALAKLCMPRMYRVLSANPVPEEHATH